MKLLGKKTLSQTEMASRPDMRKRATPPFPLAVLIAAMVSPINILYLSQKELGRANLHVFGFSLPIMR